MGYKKWYNIGFVRGEVNSLCSEFDEIIEKKINLFNLSLVLPVLTVLLFFKQENLFKG